MCWHPRESGTGDGSTKVVPWVCECRLVLWRTGLCQSPPSLFPPYRGGGTGHRCYEALEAYTRADGARYYELNSEKEASVRFWKSIGFVDNGRDEYGMPLLIKR